MQAELKAKWVEALRSGKYQQGVTYLYVKHGFSNCGQYCCLGVLLDIAGFGWTCPGRNGDHSYIRPDGTESVNCTLAYKELNEFGLINFEADLIGKNDNGTPFTRIADWIETNIPAEQTGEVA